MDSPAKNDWLHILLVEDDPSHVQLVEVALKRAGTVKVRLTHARSLNAALSRLQAEAFDAVLLDLVLPDSSGLETFSRVKDHSPAIPIVILTGLDDETLALIAVRDGAQDYVVKGTLDSTMLVRTVRYAIRRKRDADSVKASEERYRRLFEAARDGILIVDAASGEIEDVNPCLCVMLGCQPAELLGKKLWRVSAFRNLADSRETFRSLQEQDYVRRNDVPLVTKGGRRVTIEFISTIYAEGSRSVIQCNIRDITERVQAEEQVRKSEANLAAAQQIAHLGSWVWTLHSLHDFERNALSWSDEVFRILGREPGAFESSYVGFMNAVHPGDRARVIRALDATLNAGEIYDLNFRVMRPDGTERVTHSRSDLVYDQKGRPVTMLGTLQDVTEQKQLEEKLRSLVGSLSTVREEERTQISRDVHDVLGQALTGLKMDVTWLEQRLGSSQPEHKNELQDKARAALRQIDGAIVSVQRIASQLRPALLDDFGLEAAIEWQVQEWQTRTNAQCDYVSSLGDMVLSTEQATAVFRILQEALTNITRHAAASRVSILLEVNGCFLVLEVQDNGRGMQERHTAAFSRKSLGILGMQERARLVGGAVTISGEDGTGTTVIVRMPLSPEQIAHAQKHEEAQWEEQYERSPSISDR